MGRRTMGSGVEVQRFSATVRVVILLGCLVIAPLLGGQSTMQNSTTNPVPVNPLADRIVRSWTKGAWRRSTGCG